MALIKEIQRFSVVDGPGIRSVVFLKGCPMRCKWCSSPGTWNPRPEVFVSTSKCVNCGTCVQACPSGAISAGTDYAVIDPIVCTLQKRCIEACPRGAIRILGEEMSTKEVYDLLIRDSMYYEESGGGVTLSGGEPLMQIDFIVELARMMKSAGISVAIETTANFDWKMIEEPLSMMDYIFIDIKHMDPKKAIELTGCDNEWTLKNIKNVVSMGKDLTISYPYIPGMNDGAENVQAMAAFLKEAGAGKIRILPYHRLGIAEYEGLGMTQAIKMLEKIPSADIEKLKEARKIFAEAGIQTEVNGLN